MPKSFRDLDAFQLASDLAVLIYEITKSFPPSSISTVSNIAEGQGRITNGEFRQFLSQARGSLYEPDAQCLVAQRLNFMTDVDAVTRLIKRTSAASSWVN